MSEEIEKLKVEYEKKWASMERQFVLAQKVSNLELQLGRAKRDLEFEALDLKPANGLDLKTTTDDRLLTVGEAREMIDKAMQEVLDTVKRMYGG